MFLFVWFYPAYIRMCAFYFFLGKLSQDSKDPMVGFRFDEGLYSTQHHYRKNQDFDIITEIFPRLSNLSSYFPNHLPEYLGENFTEPWERGLQWWGGCF